MVALSGLLRADARLCQHFVMRYPVVHVSWSPSNITRRMHSLTHCPRAESNAERRCESLGEVRRQGWRVAPTCIQHVPAAGCVEREEAAKTQSAATEGSSSGISDRLAPFDVQSANKCVHSGTP